LARVYPGHTLRPSCEFFANAIGRVVPQHRKNEGWLKQQRHGHGQNGRAMPNGPATPGAPEDFVHEVPLPPPFGGAGSRTTLFGYRAAAACVAIGLKVG
jgi:hypothetical protein